MQLDDLRRMGFLGLLAGVFSAASLGSAHATTGTAVSGQAVHSADGIGYNYQGYNTSLALGQTPNFNFTTPNIISAVAGSAEADFGINRISNSVSIPSGDSQYAYSFMRSAWIDLILISDEDLNGQQGVFNGVVYVDMDYSSSGTPAATYANFFSVGVGSSVDSSNYGFLGFDQNPQSYQSVPLNFSVNFTFGTAFDLAVTMTSNININVLTNGPGGSITHDASNTVTWGGVVSVQNSSLQPLDPGEYALSSGSGTNYINPVPEPSTLGLFAGAVAAIFGFRRRASR
jgi:hypothetical protein